MSPRPESAGGLILSRYKRLILLGKVSLPLEEARRMVGPDCAYHLYFRHVGEDPTADGGQGKRKAKPRGRRHK